jgi:hypothetical protein
LDEDEALPTFRSFLASATAVFSHIFRVLQNTITCP